MDCACFTLMIGKAAEGYPDQELEPVINLRDLHDNDEFRVHTDDDGNKRLYKLTGRDFTFFSDSSRIEFSGYPTNSRIFELSFENHNENHVWEWVDYSRGLEIVKKDIDGVELEPLPASIALPTIIYDLQQRNDHGRHSEAIDYLNSFLQDQEKLVLLHFRN